MANEIRQNGIEFVGDGGFVNVLLPYTDYQNASSAEVLAELQKDCQQAEKDGISKEKIDKILSEGVAPSAEDVNFDPIK